MNRGSLVVLFDRGAAMPWDVVSAAEAYADVVFVLSARSPHTAELLSVLQASAETLVVTEPAEAVYQLAGRSVRGVVTFSDSMLELGAALAAELACAFHTPDIVQSLTDKLEQRRSLAAAGVPVPALSAPASPAALPAAVRRVGVPSIVKPRRSCESRHAYRVVDHAAVSRLEPILTEVWDQTGGFLVEELLGGDPAVAGHGWGDYVSVESFVHDGTARHVAVVGKFPLVEPFREAGHFFPSTLCDDNLSAVLDMATRSLSALGVQHGACHTEIKLTPDGPRVIEVNGRLGGFVSRVVEAASGVSLLGLTLADAVGDRTGVEKAAEQIAASRTVGYEISCFAGAEVKPGSILREIEGMEEVRQLPGVSAAYVTKKPGDCLDVSEGTASCLCHVYGVVADHEELGRQFAQVNNAVSARHRVR